MFFKIANFENKKKVISLVFLLTFLISVYCIIAYSEGREVFASKNKFEEKTKKMELYLGGEAAGIKLLATGVLVMGVEYNNGLAVGDVILEVDGNKIETNQELVELVQKSGDEKIKLKIERNKKEIMLEVMPKYLQNEKIYELGLWVKDSSAGVGTMTFYDKTANRFAALGHGITETEDNIVLPISSGGLVKTKITEINKGSARNPGDIRGILYTNVLGQIRKNTVNGIYGSLEKYNPYEGKEKIEVASKLDVKTGKAYIYCTLLENTVEKFEVEIEKVLYSSTGNKNIVVKITDENLLQRTGGIVQGMSGSPLVQNGKLVGAITHVFYNDSTQGYAVFIENMIEDMNSME